jgi:hypothetical protein
MVCAILEGFAGQAVHVTDPLLVALAADAALRCGQYEPGLALLDEARSPMATKRQVAYEGELLRLEAELLAASRPAERDRARQLLERATAIARAQGARSFELRATSSLASLLDALGERDAGRALLEPVCLGFTEGFDTPDLVAAARVLGLAPGELAARAAGGLDAAGSGGPGAAGSGGLDAAGTGGPDAAGSGGPDAAGAGHGAAASRPPKGRPGSSKEDQR